MSSAISYAVVNRPAGEDAECELLRQLLASRALSGVEAAENEGSARLCLLVDGRGGTAVMSSPRAVARLLLERAGLGASFPARLAEAERRVALRRRQLAVLARLEALERGEKTAAGKGAAEEEWDYSEQTARVRRALGAAPFRARRTRADYYATGLEARAAFLGAASTAQLAKLVLLRNERDPDTPPAVLAVLVQYECEGFDTKTLNVWYRKTYGRPKSKVGAEGPHLFSSSDLILLFSFSHSFQVNFRVAADGEALTGFRRNGLSPFGSALACPVLLDAAMEARLPPADKSVWLGGGEFDVKINLRWEDLVAALRPVLLSLSGPERPKQ